MFLNLTQVYTNFLHPKFKYLQIFVLPIQALIILFEWNNGKYYVVAREELLLACLQWGRKSANYTCDHGEEAALFVTVVLSWWFKLSFLGRRKSRMLNVASLKVPSARLLRVGEFLKYWSWWPVAGPSLLDLATTFCINYVHLHERYSKKTISVLLFILNEDHENTCFIVYSSFLID